MRYGLHVDSPLGTQIDCSLALNNDIEQLNHSELGWKQDIDASIELGDLLGASAFGQVFMGKILKSGSMCAVKRMAKERGKQSRSKTLDKIRLEASCLSVLGSHPGVCQLLDLYEDSSSVSLVTELCPGGDLQKLSESVGRLDELSLSLVGLEIVRVLDACHQLGMCHGDVKPGNFCLSDSSKRLFPYLQGSNIPQEPPPMLLLDDQNNLVEQSTFMNLKHSLKAIDFGSSQMLGTSTTRRSTRRTGTPAFMSPEVFARDYGLKTDMWSLGVTLYWLYSQRLPFLPLSNGANGAKRIEDVAEAVTNNEISYDFESFSSISEQGLNFLSRCLDRSETNRMSAQEALAHPWIMSAADNQERLISDYIKLIKEPAVPTTYNNIVDFSASRSFSVHY